jgi:hypothetical protein
MSMEASMGTPRRATHIWLLVLLMELLEERLMVMDQLEEVDLLAQEATVLLSRTRCLTTTPFQLTSTSMCSSKAVLEVATPAMAPQR